MTSPESDPINELHALTAKAGEALGDDATFDATIRELNDKLLMEELKRLDALIGISEQYELQLAILRSIGIMSRLSDGSEGILGEDGIEYLIPALPSIVQRFCEDGSKHELLRRKVEQGFTKLIMVPFALPLQTLVDKYGEQLRAYKAAGQLFGEGESPASNSGKKAGVLGLSENQPIYKGEEYQIQQLIYFPTSFDSENHGGLTKQEIIAQKGGWQVYLVEETPIPKQGKGAEKNGRQQLEAGLSATQHLEKLQANPQYRGEVGLTPELWLTRAITRLRERNEVTDDYQSKGSLNSLLGAYFPGPSIVAYACWTRDTYRVILDGGDADYSDERFGASSAVMI